MVTTKNFFGYFIVTMGFKTEMIPDHDKNKKIILIETPKFTFSYNETLYNGEWIVDKKDNLYAFFDNQCTWFEFPLDKFIN